MLGVDEIQLQPREEGVDCGGKGKGDPVVMVGRGPKGREPENVFFRIYESGVFGREDENPVASLPEFMGKDLDGGG
jgi:hypothetical protein